MPKYDIDIPRGKKMKKVIFLALFSLMGSLAMAQKSEAVQAYQRGMNAYLNNQYYEAIGEFNEAINISPDYLNAYIYRGIALASLGYYSQAFVDLDKALELDPTNAVAYHARGYAYSLKRDYDHSISNYYAALTFDPNNATLKRILANVVSEKQKAQASSNRDMVVAKFSVRDGAVTPVEAEGITDLFTAELQKTGKLRVVNRGNTDRVAAAMQFQSSDWSDPIKTEQLGAALNAGYLVTGQIAKLDRMITIVITALDIKTLVVVSSSAAWFTAADIFNPTSEFSIFASMPNLARSITNMSDLKWVPVAVMSTFSTQGQAVSSNDAETITEVFMQRLAANGRLRVIDRKSLDKVASRINFQTSDWSNPQKTAQLCAALNARYVITGQLNQLGDTISASFNVVDMQTVKSMAGVTERFTPQSIFNATTNTSLWYKMSTMANSLAVDVNAQLPPPNLFVGRWSASTNIDGDTLSCILNIQENGFVVVERYDTITTTVHYTTQVLDTILNWIFLNPSTSLTSSTSYSSNFDGKGTGNYRALKRTGPDEISITVSLNLTGTNSGIPAHPVSSVTLDPGDPTTFTAKVGFKMNYREETGKQTGSKITEHGYYRFTRLD